MIRITKTDQSIEVLGHSGYAPAGQDIVCSAISALTQNLVLSIEELTDDIITYDVNAGHAVITYRNLSERAQLLVDSFFIGCEAVALSYPDNVQVSKK